MLHSVMYMVWFLYSVVYTVSLSVKYDRVETVKTVAMMFAWGWLRATLSHRCCAG